MLKYTVKCEKQELFIGLIPFQTIYALSPDLNIHKWDSLQCDCISWLCGAAWGIERLFPRHPPLDFNTHV